MNGLTFNKRTGYGYLYSWWAANSGLLGPYPGNDGLRVLYHVSPFNPMEAYFEGEYVLYNNNLYLAIQDVPEDHQPDYYPSYWQLTPTKSIGDHPYTENYLILDQNTLYEFSDWLSPTQDELQHLVNTVGSLSANKLRAMRHEWLAHSHKPTDEFMFSALPAGQRSASGEFSNLRASTGFWSQTQSSQNQNNGMFLFLGYNLSAASVLSANKKAGFSIRLRQKKLQHESNGHTGIIADTHNRPCRFVVIGNYRWLTSNLQVSLTRDSTQLPIITDPVEWSQVDYPAICAFNNDPYLVSRPGHIL